MLPLAKEPLARWQEIITLSCQHNDANILNLGARFRTEAEAQAAVILWLQAPFSGEAHHARRLAKLDIPQ